MASPSDGLAARLDHVVVVVEDLEAATGDFSELGFRVTPGGVHAGGLTRNALILLQDGTYVELLGFAVPLQALEKAKLVTPLDRRLAPRGRAGEGVRDLALGARDLETVCDALRTAGLEVEGPLPGSRTRPDGTELRWSLAFPEDPRLPFLIEDITPRHLRVPGGDAACHPNGVTGIAGVAIRVDDVEAAAEAYGHLENLGKVARADMVALRFPNATITLVQRQASSSPDRIVFCAPAGRSGEAVDCRGVRMEFVECE